MGQTGRTPELSRKDLVKAALIWVIPSAIAFVLTIRLWDTPIVGPLAVANAIWFFGFYWFGFWILDKLGVIRLS